MLVTAVVFSWIGAPSSWAEYRDLIDTPVLKMASAPQSLLLDVAEAGNRLVAVGERGHIVTSDDRGANWTQSDVATRAHLNAVVFVDDKKGWAVGEDAVILHTSDGGKIWQRQFDDRDAGARGPLLDLCFLSEQVGFAVGVYNKLFKTIDGGKTWEDWSEHVDNLDEWHLFAIAAATNDVIYVASEQGLLFRSVDAGESFAPLQTVHQGSFHGILVKHNEDGTDRLVLTGVGGKLIVSDDSGETWTELNTGTQAGLSGSTWLADGSALIVGHDGQVLVVDSELATVSPFPQDNGLALSSVTTVDADKLVLVGFGGVQTIDTPQPAE